VHSEKIRWRLYLVSDEVRRPEVNPGLAGRTNDAGKEGVRPRNWLVPVTLMLLRQCASHGYELMERAVELGFQTINPGTIYRTLRKMEQDELCASHWETADGRPPRRLYSITDAGEAHLALWVIAMEQYRQTVDSFLLAYKNNGGAYV
jgi:PadR family transcriptional regulator